MVQYDVIGGAGTRVLHDIPAIYSVEWSKRKQLGVSLNSGFVQFLCLKPVVWISPAYPWIETDSTSWMSWNFIWCLKGLSNKCLIYNGPSNIQWYFWAPVGLRWYDLTPKSSDEGKIFAKNVRLLSQQFKINAHQRRPWMSNLFLTANWLGCISLKILILICMNHENHGIYFY